MFDLLYLLLVLGTLVGVWFFSDTDSIFALKFRLYLDREIVMDDEYGRWYETTEINGVKYIDYMTGRLRIEKSECGTYYTLDKAYMSGLISKKLRIL